MLPVLSLFVLLSPAADASESVLRPVTFPSNPALTYFYVENFRELYVDPASAGASLVPSGPPRLPEGLPEGGPGPSVPPLGSLPVVNTHNSWADITVEGVKVGKIGPLTVGAIHNVRSGSYAVSFAYPNGYTLSSTVGTEVISEPIVPGGPGAKVAIGEQVEPQPKATPPAAPKMKVATPPEEAPAEQSKDVKLGDQPAKSDEKTLEKKSDK